MTISWTCESLGGHKVLCPWFLLISQAKLRSLNSPPVALQNGQKASETRHEVSHEAAFHPTVARDVWPVLLSLSLNSTSLSDDMSKEQTLLWASNLPKQPFHHSRKKSAFLILATQNTVWLSASDMCKNDQGLCNLEACFSMLGPTPANI